MEGSDESAGAMNISPIWGLVIGIIAVVIAIVAIILIFVIPGPAGPAGPAGTPGAKGNDGASAASIKYSALAVYNQTTDSYSLPSPYNYTNIVIPTRTNNVYFTIKASDVVIGDVFNIDNTNNPTFPLYIQYQGFGNNLTPTSIEELSINHNGSGRINIFNVQISAGKTAANKNIMISSIPNILTPV